jgi:hypothetical protein
MIMMHKKPLEEVCLPAAGGGAIHADKGLCNAVPGVANLPDILMRKS